MARGCPSRSSHEELAIPGVGAQRRRVTAGRGAIPSGDLDPFLLEQAGGHFGGQSPEQTTPTSASPYGTWSKKNFWVPLTPPRMTLVKPPSVAKVPLVTAVQLVRGKPRVEDHRTL